MTSTDLIQPLVDRLDGLETAIAHQEVTMEDLNRVVLDQWRRIDELTRQIGLLTDRLHEAEDRLDLGAPREPPPPHY